MFSRRDVPTKYQYMYSFTNLTPIGRFLDTIVAVSFDVMHSHVYHNNTGTYPLGQSNVRDAGGKLSTL